MATLSENSKPLAERAIEVALDGNPVALRFCLKRLAPPVKDSPTKVKLPELKSAKDAHEVLVVIAHAMSEGKITPSKATVAAGVVEAYRKTFETSELEARLSAVEKKHD